METIKQVLLFGGIRTVNRNIKINLSETDIRDLSDCIIAMIGKTGEAYNIPERSVQLAARNYVTRLKNLNSYILGASERCEEIEETK